MATMTRLSPALNTLLLFAVVIACAGSLLAQPRAVAWQETPPLTLPVEPVRKAMADDAKAAASAPQTVAAKKLDALWLELGHGERDGLEPSHMTRARHRDLHAAFDVVVRESGQPAALAVRAAATERLDAALDIELAPELARDVLGNFPIVLQREECTRGGELIAPRFVVRTLYKARWNISHEQTPDLAFTPIERRAYYGWQALHARRLPLEQRLEALLVYQRNGGTRVNEAVGVMLQRSAQSGPASAAFAAAYRSVGTLRLRNAQLAQMDAPHDGSP
jgi:hypothetical protein